MRPARQVFTSPLFPCRMQGELLHSPIQELRDEERVFGRARNLMHPSKLAELLARFPENAEDVSVQVDLVDPALVGVGCIEHLVRTGSDAHGPGGADVGPLAEKSSFAIENLDAVILAITDVDVSFRVGGDAVHGMKLARRGPALAPGLHPVA